MKREATSPDYSRPIMFFMSKGGECVFAPRWDPNFKKFNSLDSGFLPLMSVFTRKEAEELRLRLCKLTREPDSTTYKYPAMDGTLNSLFEASKTFERAYATGGFGR